MRLIEIAEPAVSAHEVEFSWTVTPASELYRESRFRLRFPDTVDVSSIPRSLWWRIGLLCLQAHWPLLRPCRIVLPVQLPASEIEFWLRLTDAAVATLEAHIGGEDTERTIEIACAGPPLPAPEPPEKPGAGVVSCFSGGRDSTVQAAMLCELGARPVLVTVTSPGPWSREHETPRRREVLAEVVRRRSLELVEIQSDLRSSWENSFAAGRYGVSVNELTDTFLYLAAAVAVARARGAELVTLASEAEVQDSSRRAGMVVQMRHFMYSAVTLGAISALLKPSGIAVGSLTSSLRQFQVQRLLAQRYPDLRDLQYSCWELSDEQAACSRCRECRGIALNLVADGVSPAVAGIDLTTLLLANAEWRPGERYLAGPPAAATTPSVLTGRSIEMQELRCLAATPPGRVAALLDGGHPADELSRALQIYERLRSIALAQEVAPEPGYREGYLALVDERLRPGLRAILEEHFEPAPGDAYAATLENTLLLTRWIARPLAPARGTGESDPDRDPDWIAELIPDPEPELEAGPDGRRLRVGQTLLDGNELAYATAAIEENWVSSAGPFVPRFEREFAEAVGCRYGIACSSGASALQLALAGAGISAGDEVIVPAFTMIATANAPVHLGAEPVLIDADPHTWNLDPALLADKLTPRTRAIMAVHIYGQPAEMEAIREFARRNRLVVIEDAAEAHGATYAGRPVGSIGEVAAFSFYGNKILTTGEGGIVTTNDARIAGLARELRDHAFSHERHFWHRRIGFNFRMSNLQAAIGVAQTERLRELVARRAEHARCYRAALAGIDGIGLPPALPGGVNWMFGITVDQAAFGIGRDELRRQLAARGVETRTFFVPLHLQPVYRSRFAGQRYPVAEQLGRTGLYLPSGSNLSEQEIDYVAQAVRDSQPVASTSV